MVNFCVLCVIASAILQLVLKNSSKKSKLLHRIGVKKWVEHCLIHYLYGCLIHYLYGRLCFFFYANAFQIHVDVFWGIVCPKVPKLAIHHAFWQNKELFVSCNLMQINDVYLNWQITLFDGQHNAGEQIISMNFSLFAQLQQ